MTDRKWVPLRLRGSDDISQHRGPFEGVPEWLFGPLWTWVVDQMPVWYRGFRASAITEYRGVAMALRVSIDDPQDPNPTDARGLQANLLDLVKSEGELLLDVADYVASQMDLRGADRDEGRKLASILDSAGSAWSLREGPPPRLERRVSGEETSSAMAVMDTAGRAGQHIAVAWGAAYGRQPDATKAYREAVRAVEAAAEPSISPQNSKETLGTMIADMKAKPDRWRVLLGGADQEAAVLHVAGIMELLWKGQYDRHGTANSAVPMAVSPEEAEAAVQLAVPLVQWFTSGTITPASQPSPPTT